MTARSLETHPIHLGAGGTAVPQPEFPPDERAMAWYMDYGARHGGDPEGRLVQFGRFSEDWTSWEMHPGGAEVVLCISGEMVLIQELADDHVEHVTLKAGDYAINPPGVWHTADVSGEATGLFFTAAMGTEHRPR